MAKQSLKQRETEVALENGIGKQIERTLTVDDLALPSASELEADAKDGSCGIYALSRPSMVCVLLWRCFFNNCSFNIC